MDAQTSDVHGGDEQREMRDFCQREEGEPWPPAERVPYEPWPVGKINPATMERVPTRHPNSARFHEILREAGELHDKKQQDYGRGADPFANVRASAEFGVKPWIGAYIRLNDKITRIKSFIEKGVLANESLEDSLRDVIVYSAIALVLYEEERK